MPNLKSQPELRGAYFLYLFLWKKKRKTRREKEFVNVLSSHSELYNGSAEWQELNYWPTTSTKILREVALHSNISRSCHSNIILSWAWHTDISDLPQSSAHDSLIRPHQRLLVSFSPRAQNIPDLVFCDALGCSPVQEQQWPGTRWCEQSEDPLAF